MTNLVHIIVLVVTNWVTVPGDQRTEGGTSYVHQVRSVMTNYVVEEVFLCTNQTLYRQNQRLEATQADRWLPLGTAFRDAGGPPMPVLQHDIPYNLLRSQKE